jgi:hypothetical protein
LVSIGDEKNTLIGLERPLGKAAGLNSVTSIFACQSACVLEIRVRRKLSRKRFLSLYSHFLLGILVLENTRMGCLARMGRPA